MFWRVGHTRPDLLSFSMFFFHWIDVPSPYRASPHFSAAFYSLCFIAIEDFFFLFISNAYLSVVVYQRFVWYLNKPLLTYFRTHSLAPSLTHSTHTELKRLVVCRPEYCGNILSSLFGDVIDTRSVLHMTQPIRARANRQQAANDPSCTVPEHFFLAWQGLNLIDLAE